MLIFGSNRYPFVYIHSFKMSVKIPLVSIIKINQFERYVKFSSLSSQQPSNNQVDPQKATLCNSNE